MTLLASLLPLTFRPRCGDCLLLHQCAPPGWPALVVRFSLPRPFAPTVEAGIANGFATASLRIPSMIIGARCNPCAGRARFLWWHGDRSHRDHPAAVHPFGEANRGGRKTVDLRRRHHHHAVDVRTTEGSLIPQCQGKPRVFWCCLRPFSGGCPSISRRRR
jgi:hypothetical protein